MPQLVNARRIGWALMALLLAAVWPVVALLGLFSTANAWEQPDPLYDAGGCDPFCSGTDTWGSV